MIATLNKFARLASARSEVVGASLIILMVAMMVIPLSPFLLDILLAVNISAAILLAISAVLIETPLAFSSFPAILLMTTLFRLSLTISTTRQILLEADAGHIVQTFGEFVVGGNIAVGLTIFIIISVVNFLVVTKGSERIAEVAERQEQVPIGVTMASNIVQDLTSFAKRQGTKGISVRQEEDKVEIDAELSRAQAMEFERELIRFGRDYGQFVQLKANLRFTPEQKLVDEIRVSQIVFGKAAAVILQDGEMLFEGGKYNGLTITQISMDKVVLDGTTSYEVPL